MNWNGWPSLRKTLFFLSITNERDEEKGMIDKTTTIAKHNHAPEQPAMFFDAEAPCHVKPMWLGNFKFYARGPG